MALSLIVLLGFIGVDARSESIAADRSPADSRSVLDLAGDWRVRIDPGRAGEDAGWYRSLGGEPMSLPGALHDAGLGTPAGPPTFNGPALATNHIGWAWYQREVRIDPSWAGRRIVLSIERCKWLSKVWIDDACVGEFISLMTPHVYDVTAALTPGRHRITILVDNSNTIEADAQAPADVSGGPTTQPATAPAGAAPARVKRFHCGSSGITWHGLIGRIRLTATEPIWIEQVRIDPDVPGRAAKVRLKLGNLTGQEHAGQVLLTLRAAGEEAVLAEVAEPVALSATGETVAELAVNVPDPLRLWSEFEPALYELTASLSVERPGGAWQDVQSRRFGMRELSVAGRQILMNGRPIFLRGRVDHCIFPLTGYPAMDEGWWRHVFTAAKDYGLNMFRFHSWCPPEEAFRLADELGIMLQVEPPTGSGPYEVEPPATTGFLDAECLRIADTYGHHPSFCFFSTGGNEQLTAGYPYDAQREALQKILLARMARVRAYDPRHLYTATSHPWTTGRDDDYYQTGWGEGFGPLGKPRPNYGCNWGGPDGTAGSRFIEQPLSTLVDYAEVIAPIPGPVVTHEMGQWAVYPDLRDLERFNGALRPGNIEQVKASLEKQGLLDQAADFVRASGLLSLRLYKEEIEAQLRTPGICGFQLLDLVDYPFQSTAPVGLLNAIWQSKGLVTPAEYREFCSPTVPLLRTARRTWLDNERITGEVLIAHYGPRELKQVSPTWSLEDAQGGTLRSGSWPRIDLPTGGNTSLGMLVVPLEGVQPPVRVRLVVSLNGTEIANRWDFWIYPSAVDDAVPAHVVIHRGWSEAAAEALHAGQRVLLLVGEGDLARSKPGIFTTVYWSPLYFKDRQVGTYGLLIDADHPAFGRFPTDLHTDWQWWDAVSHSRAMVLDDLPRGLRPIVRVIDQFDTNHHLGSLFEARVGKGRLMVCAFDLAGDLSDRPVSRQLKRSLLDYMAGEQFNPEVEVDLDELSPLFVKSQRDSHR